MKKREKVIFIEKNYWGGKFEIKELSRGFVKNYLFPRGLILFYNEKNKRWLEKCQKKQEQENNLLEENAHELYKKIHNLTLSFTLKKDEKGNPFGSVSHNEILAELKNKGFDLKKNQLLNFYPLREEGDNDIQIRLSKDIIASLKVVIQFS